MVTGDLKGPWYSGLKINENPRYKYREIFIKKNYIRVCLKIISSPVVCLLVFTWTDIYLYDDVAPYPTGKKVPLR